MSALRWALTVAGPFVLMGALIKFMWWWVQQDAKGSTPLGGWPADWDRWPGDGSDEDGGYPFGDERPFGSYPDEARWLAESGLPQLPFGSYSDDPSSLRCPRCGSTVAHFCPSPASPWVAPR